MITIGFVVTSGFPVMSLAALSVFEFANVSTQIKQYDVRLLSEQGGPVITASGLKVDTEAFEDANFDTLIIGGNTAVVPTSRALLGFVAAAAKTSRRISSICTGAFALAEAGLLDERRVTTHWLFTQELKARFPKVILEENRIFVIDGPVWTAAGNSAGIDLTLSMLEKDLGPDVAHSVAQILVIYHRRSGAESQESALLNMKAKSDRIQSSLAFARSNLRTALSVEQLAHAARLSPRQFARTFRAETGQTPAKAVENLRLEAARFMLEHGRHPVEVVAAETGFGDQERMRRAFLRVFGRPPRAFRRSVSPSAPQDSGSMV